MDRDSEEKKQDAAAWNEERHAEGIFESEAQWFSGRQVYRRRPKQANQIIGQLMARKGFNQNESYEQIQTIWNSILDERLRGFTRATGIRAGKLMVIVENAVIHQELAFRKSDLLEKIKKSPIGNRVKDIRFQIGVF